VKRVVYLVEGRNDGCNGCVRFYGGDRQRIKIAEDDREQAGAIAFQFGARDFLGRGGAGAPPSMH